jgi:hypothetical protein
MTSLDEILDDLWDPAGTPVNLPEADEAITTQVTYTELELQLSAIADERGES